MFHNFANAKDAYTTRYICILPHAWSRNSSVIKRSCLAIRGKNFERSTSDVVKVEVTEGKGDKNKKKLYIKARINHFRELIGLSLTCSAF